MNLKILTVCSVIVFFVAQSSFIDAASAGVSPATYDVNFEPNVQGDFVFSYRFGDNSLELNITLDGDLASYVSLDKTRLPPEGGTVTAHLDLPAIVSEPGTHRIVVLASPDFSSVEGGGLGVVPSVGGVIKVHVPYPGKYAEIEFEIQNSNERQQTPYHLVIHSRGKELVQTTSQIEVFDAESKSVGFFSLGTQDIDSGSSKELRSEIDTSNLGSGNYKAVANVLFDGGKQTKEDLFKIGQLFVGIVNFTSSVEKNKINSFNIEIESFWNERIEHVYAEVFVQGTEISFTTPSVSLEKWSKKTLAGYLDTSGLEGEQLSARIVVHYGEEKTEKDIVVLLSKGESKINYLVIGIVLGVVLVVALLVWFYIRLKRMERKYARRK